VKRILLVLSLALYCSLTTLPPSAAPTPYESRVSLSLPVFRLHLRLQTAGFRYPAWWMAQAHCIHWHEAVSGSTPTARDLAYGWRIHWHLTTAYGTGEPSGNRGGFQIAFSTWQSYAPRGYPSDPAAATRAQQVLVAHRIWVANGHRWGGGQWPGTAAACDIS